MPETINIKDLSFRYEKQPTLNDVNVQLPLGSFVLFTGPSGSGKSTLLHLIAGLLPKYGGHLDSGTVTIPHSATVGMMFQHPETQFALDTPEHEMQFALENMQINPANMPTRIDHALRFCGIETLKHRQLATLSGGEQQRVALAEIICMDAPIILLDEPFASVDEDHRRFLLTALVKLQKQAQKTIIIADHDLHGYRQYADTMVTFAHHHAQVATSAQMNQLFQVADRQAAKISSHSLTLPNNKERVCLSLHDFQVTRGHRQLIAAKQFDFYQNRVTLLTGPTGVGKSTLIDSCAHLTAYDGQVLYHGQPTEKINQRRYAKLIAVVFQHASDQFLNVTVGEELALSHKNGQNKYFTSDRVHDELAKLGLSGMDDRVVYSLSGGQQKKLQILLMLMMGQPVLLMDEPFTGLDEQSLIKVIDLIQRSCQAHPQTIVIISHQLAHLEKLADFHVQLQDHHLTYQEVL